MGSDWVRKPPLNLMNSHWIFWIGCRVAHSMSSFCDFDKIAICDFSQFFSFDTSKPFSPKKVFDKEYLSLLLNARVWLPWCYKGQGSMNFAQFSVRLPWAKVKGLWISCKVLAGSRRDNTLLLFVEFHYATTTISSQWNQCQRTGLVRYLDN